MSKWICFYSDKKITRITEVNDDYQLSHNEAFCSDEQRASSIKSLLEGVTTSFYLPVSRIDFPSDYFTLSVAVSRYSAILTYLDGKEIVITTSAQRSETKTDKNLQRTPS